MTRDVAHLRGRLLVGLIVTTLLVQAGPALSQVNPAAGGRAESGVTVTGSRTAEELSACLQQRPNLAVAVLIDETGSLRQTDPQNERAPVLAGFLSRLEDLSGTDFGDRTRQVLVTVAYFGTGVDEFLPWQPVATRLADPTRGEGATRSISQAILEVTPARNRDLTTEFSAAIAWAADRHLEVERLIDPASVCTLTVWFSDGELDPDNQPRAPYERDAVISETQALCDARGVLDAHRRTGAVLVGILLVELLTDSSSVTTLPRMHAMVEGVDPDGRACGVEPSRGLYLEGGLDLLSLQFERAVTPGQGGVLQGTYRGDPVTFVVDPGVAKVRVVMSARDGFRLTTATGARIEVAQPGGAPSTSGLPRGVRPDIRWASGAVSLDLEVAGAVGEWEVRREGRESEVDVYYFSDLRLEVDLDEIRLTSGDPGALQGRVVDGSGGSVDLGLYSSRELRVTVDGSTAEAVLQVDGTFIATFPVDTQEARIPADLRLDLVTTGGTPLQTITREVLLPVTLPGWFPQVAIAREFDRNLAPGSEDVRLPVIITGSDLGATRVCVQQGVPGDGVPELVRLVTLRWDGDDLSRCIDLAAGEEVRIDLVATLQEADVRSVRVGIPLTVVLESAAVDGRPSVTVDYPERRTLVVEPPAPNPIIVLILLLLGLLIPLIILHLLNRSAARFRTRNLQAARVPVELVRTHGSWRVERSGRTGAPLLAVDDLAYLPTDGPDGKSHWGAHWQVPGASSGVATTTGERWRAVVPRWPLGTVHAVVEAPPGTRVISNEVPTVTDDGRQSGIGLNPQRSAYLLIADSDLRSIDAVDDVRVPATLVTVLGHAGHTMGEVVDHHAGQLEHVLTGGAEVDGVAAAARVADASRAEGTGGTEGKAGPTASTGAWSDPPTTAGAWTPGAWSPGTAPSDRSDPWEPSPKPSGPGSAGGGSGSTPGWD
jgi:hypothetical protein